MEGAGFSPCQIVPVAASNATPSGSGLVRRSCEQRERLAKAERGHLLSVSYQQNVAHDDRVVPGLAVERGGLCDFRVLVRCRADQCQLTVFGDYEQQILLGQQEQLPVAVATALPVALAVLEVDRREDVAVETDRVAFVDDEVVEVRLEPV